MSSETIIQVSKLGKRYRIYRAPRDRMKEMLLGRLTGRSYGKDFWALRDVTFDVRRGEMLGIIGRNGSGKSTLLQCIAGTLEATEGQSRVDGRLAALLELGSGFNPEFTGRENVFTYGAIMGMSAAEMQKRFDAIAEFAAIGAFIDQPAKTYSSGMFARLAFSAAIHIDPSILIVDEALSVGDALFQNKCFHRLHELRKRGVTVLFVSHDLSAVHQLCSRVLWLEDGKTRAFGEAQTVCQQYLSTILEENSRNAAPAVRGMETGTATAAAAVAQTLTVPRLPAGCLRSGSGGADIVSLYVRDSQGAITMTLTPGQTYSVHVLGKMQNDVPQAIFGFTMENVRGIPVLTTNSLLCQGGTHVAKAGDTCEAIFSFEMPRLQSGRYVISPAIACGSQEQHVVLCWYHAALGVEVRNPGHNLSLIEVQTRADVLDRSASRIEFSEPAGAQ